MPDLRSKLGTVQRTTPASAPSRIHFRPQLFLLLHVALLPGIPAISQQLPPAEPPKPLAGASSESPTIRVTTNEVLVPTLVEKGGQVVYGLKQGDFILEDNGVPQKIRVQEEMDSAPVALVVAVEQGRSSALEFDKVARISPLLDLFLTDARSQVALIGFDSKPHLIHDYTHSSDELTNALQHLEPGDGGAAILDTISSAVDLLQTEPKEYRRVLLLISEERDHGSKHTKPVQLIQKIGRTEVLVLSISFSPSRAEFLSDLAGHNQAGASADLLAPLMMAINAMKKNVTKEVALESGGEYATFTVDKRFEERVVDAAKHVRNRYLITFSPSNPTPGLHSIRVRTAQDYGARIVARANYWVSISR
ncbi:MAG TPA: VWA domain-containing protein [Terracidiphilus sp.]|nr:VWA domain-containing protein [Terracidiphilus sp.]